MLLGKASTNHVFGYSATILYTNIWLTPYTNINLPCQLTTFLASIRSPAALVLHSSICISIWWSKHKVHPHSCRHTLYVMPSLWFSYNYLITMITITLMINWYKGHMYYGHIIYFDWLLVLLLDEIPNTEANSTYTIL